MEPGYKKIEFKPFIPEELESISATYESIMGAIQSEWHQTDEHVTFHITVSNNSTGRVYEPASNRESVSIEQENGGEPVTFTSEEEGRIIYEAGAGSYTFSVTK